MRSWRIDRGLFIRIGYERDYPRGRWSPICEELEKSEHRLTNPFIGLNLASTPWLDQVDFAIFFESRIGEILILMKRGGYIDLRARTREGFGIVDIDINKRWATGL